MTYDPQANRPRPKPPAGETAPVDALIGDSSAPTSPADSTDGAKTPSPAAETQPTDPSSGSPRVTPRPADPVPDSIIAGTGVAAVVGAIVTLLSLRWLWRRAQQAGTASPES